MNLEIFKQPDPSGRLYKESYLFKNYKEEYDYIIEYCQLNKIFDITFKEKVYLCLNNLKKVPTCKHPDCNKKVKYKNSTIGYLEYCSVKCISSDPNIKKIKEEKSFEKWGTKTPTQSKEVKDKIIKTNQEKWGGNSPMSNKKIQEKSKNTLIKNWGVENPAKSEEILNKRIESFKKSNYKENFKKICNEKWGVDHPWMNKDIHKKTVEFFYSDYKQRIEEKIKNSEYTFIGFEKSSSGNLIFHCKKCNSNFNILSYQFYYRQNNNNPICTNCYPISENASISQIELYNFIKDNYTGEIISDCKNIIDQYEIDVYLPEIKIGFEFNGIYWHSEKFKDNKYHLNKHRKAVSNNIKLYSIWEDDWNIKKEICKSFILNKLGKTNTKIYARNCKVVEITHNEARKFLNSNHLQGNCNSSIRLGLYYNEKIVSVMTFSKLRKPLNRELKNSSNIYELTRFCNEINISVVGGASKLLKYFINKYSPVSIETYSDNLISDGNLYQKIGFIYSHTSDPGYWYVINNVRNHRFNWRKQVLVKLGHDVNKTEEEIMLEMGYYRIYNAGNKKWILNL